MRLARPFNSSARQPHPFQVQSAGLVDVRGPRGEGPPEGPAVGVVAALGPGAAPEIHDDEDAIGAVLAADARAVAAAGDVEQHQGALGEKGPRPDRRVWKGAALEWGGTRAEMPGCGLLCVVQACSATHHQERSTKCFA